MNMEHSTLRTQILVVAIGSLLYAIITVRLNVLIMPGTELTAVRPSVVVPMLIGFLFGPRAGFLTGFLGNVLGDVVTFNDFFWPWDIGNGIMGAVPGLAYVLLDRERRLGRTGLLWAPPLAVAGAVLGMGFAVPLDLYMGLTVNTVQQAWTVFVSAAATDALNGAVLLPILVLIYSRLLQLSQKTVLHAGPVEDQVLPERE
ncbi:MAG: ECF transporter S component [Methanomassiliicoccus sp.]|jgi:energy-coupling factor transport system substrate-specific component|nr:ECF transporter S component [Methanomassiliicoccus sp.]